MKEKEIKNKYDQGGERIEHDSPKDDTKLHNNVDIRSFAEIINKKNVIKRGVLWK